MKFTVSSALLSERLQVLSRVISNKQLLPILNYFLFSIEDGRLTISASDSETTIQATVGVENQGGNGRVAVLARYMLNILHEFGDQPITFDIDDHSYSITLTSETGQYSFMGQSGDEYPPYRTLNAENTVTLNIPAALLLDGISQTLFAVANDDLRPIMNGICFDLTPDSLNLVGTDAHKLARFKMLNVKTGANTTFVFPQKPASVLKSILTKVQDDVSLQFDDKIVMCRFADYLLVCRQIEGKFPSYNAVIPEDNPMKVIVDRGAFLSAMRRVSVCTSQASSLVRLSISENQLHLSGQDLDFSVSGNETVVCQYQGEPIEIGFKAVLIIEILSNMNASEIVLALADKTRPGTFIPLQQNEGTDALMLLMPMMLA